MIPAGTALLLLSRYFLITLIIAVLVKLSMKDPAKSFIMIVVLLAVFFLFGAVKTVFENVRILLAFSSYSIFLPLTFVGILIVFMLLQKSARSPIALARYLKILLVILASFELAHLAFNVTFKNRDPDFGDNGHSLINGMSIAKDATKPHIFWIVMDEYSAGSTLRKKWNYENPLDSILEQKGFFVDESATSPFNFTHYSMGSELDMQYFALRNNQEVRYQDMVLGDRSVFKNNVVTFLQRNGYAVKNFTMFDMKGLPAHPMVRFRSDPAKLVTANTMAEKIQRDIGWQFTNRFETDKEAADSVALRKEFAELAKKQRDMTGHYKNVVSSTAKESQPHFLMFQYMLTHEPFLFNEDGTLHTSPSFSKPDAYLSSVQFANSVIADMVETIQRSYTDKDYIIILQSDHGFKFEESDPLFEEESCKILYAVYSSDGNNSEWSEGTGAVNTFRKVFTKYFDCNLPDLPVRSFILRYRR